MFWPKIVSPARQPRKRAAVACARSTSSSLRRLAANAPPRFAFDSRRYVAIASITERGHCVPPGASRKATPEPSAGNCARTASRSMVEDAIYPCSSGASVNPCSRSCSQ